jgi:hypothetical protein
MSSFIEAGRVAHTFILINLRIGFFVFSGGGGGGGCLILKN